jgi:sigma-B regulation protein RsbU (phosphoserine phosphatase)
VTNELGRLELWAAATELITREGHLTDALRDLAGLFLPSLADWAVVDLLTAPSQLARVAVLHRDPEVAPVGRYERDLPPLTTSASSLARALLSGELVQQHFFADPGEADSDLHREQLRLFSELGARHAVTVPIRQRGQVLGAFTLVRISRPAFTTEEIALIEGVARRSALAIENDRLYAEHVNTAIAFQRALLPSLPRPDHLHLTARYVPARVSNAVGGDWYDAFVGADGITTLVIGDVMGHDQQSAVRMAELRNLLRGCAWHAPGVPSAILDRLSDAALGLELPVLASVLCGRIHQTGSGHLFRWANAGHLPPLLVEASGQVRLLQGDTGVLLGVTRGRHVDTEAEVPPGSKLLLYTDGLVEHRGDLGRGLHDLSELARSLAGHPVEELADAVIDALGRERDDDVALLVVGFPL